MLDLRRDLHPVDGPLPGRQPCSSPSPPRPGGPGRADGGRRIFRPGPSFNQMAVFFVLALAVLLTLRLNAREAADRPPDRGRRGRPGRLTRPFTAARPAASAGSRPLVPVLCLQPRSHLAFSNVSSSACASSSASPGTFFSSPRSLLVPASIVSGVLCAGLAAPADWSTPWRGAGRRTRGSPWFSDPGHGPVHGGSARPDMSFPSPFFAGFPDFGPDFGRRLGGRAAKARRLVLSRRRPSSSSFFFST